jgi:hypothetical protein
MHVSLIIECENVKDVGTDRAGRVMRALREQIVDVYARRAIRGEIMVMHAAGSTNADEVRVAVCAALGPSCPWPVRAIACEGPPYQYYEQKNLAGRLAQGDLLLYLDSDCIPQPGWLESLLAAFDRPDVVVCAGVTSIDRDTRYSRLFAFLSDWPIHDPGAEPLVVDHSFNANNVAFRRATFRAHPYPDNGSYKARCVQLWQELAASGITIHRANRALVLHPAPVNPRHFAAKAIGLGHDYGLQFRNRGGAGRRPALAFAQAKFSQNFSATRARLLASERPVAVGTRALALALSAVYFAIAAAATVAATRAHGPLDRFLGLAAHD